MQAFHRNAAVQSSQLRNSYIEISNIIRSRYHVRTVLRRHRHVQARRLSAGACLNLPKSKHSALPSITEGFPTPPEIGFVEKVSSKPTIVDRSDPSKLNSLEPREKETYGGGVQTASKSTDLPSKTADALARFSFQQSAMADAQTWSWDALEALQEAPEGGSANAADIKVRLFGFLASYRRGRNGPDFIQLVDPQMRRSVQLKWYKYHDQNVQNSGTFSAGPQGTGDHASEYPSSQTQSGILNNEVEEADETPPLKIRQVRADVRLEDLVPHAPVVISGFLHKRPRPRGQSSGVQGTKEVRTSSTQVFDPYVGAVELIGHLEIDLTRLRLLNHFPRSLVAKNSTVFPPEQRVLQLRTDADLRKNIRQRSKVMALCRKFFFMKGFDEIETPLLFKSTPEGAREFVVPTRRPGMAYALPQSPQQYKQMLMASGFARYFQFARCFRDEDMRADRQPEFTQLDLEMSFARRENVMVVIERLVASTIWPAVRKVTPYANEMKSDPAVSRKDFASLVKPVFPQYTYDQVMTAYGSDKPDTRLGARISRVEERIPESLKKMLTTIEDPAVEMLKIAMNGATPETSGQFITGVLDDPRSATYLANLAGQPGVTIFDPSKPLNGLASFGHDSARFIEELMKPKVGDILVLQAREKTPFTGGSTPLGNLRRDILHAAISQGLRDVPDHDDFLWVTDFPLFSPVDDTEPGQSGTAGICSTHHPFTAPKTERDISKLVEDPLSVTGDHYDLVVNGVEVGGGSVRIHNAGVQEIVLRDVLKMSRESVANFDHLLSALRAGCPPHAGFALGFDRLMAILLRKNSIRDVIAFPKAGDGEDKMVGAPSLLNPEQLDTYHLQVKEGGGAETAPRISLKA